MEIKPTSCYIAGPMKGIKNFNWPLFDSLAAFLRSKGWTVWNPSEHDDEVWPGMKGSKAAEAGDVDAIIKEFGFSLSEAMSWDLNKVIASNAIVMLPRWETSTGAKYERLVAEVTGKQVYLAKQITYVKEDGWNLELDNDQCRLTKKRKGSKEFHALLQQIADLHDKKQEDYGADNDPFANVRASQEWGIAPWLGTLIRLNDKVHRLKQFAKKGSLANESVEDSLMDISVYALIALILYREATQ